MVLLPLLQKSILFIRFKSINQLQYEEALEGRLGSAPPSLFYSFATPSVCHSFPALPCLYHSTALPIPPSDHPSRCHEIKTYICLRVGDVNPRVSENVFYTVLRLRFKIAR